VSGSTVEFPGRVYPCSAMGSRFHFWCRRCGFEANVSGGYDVGYSSGLHTYACRECGVLFDTAVTDTPWEFDRRTTPRKVACTRAPEDDSHIAVIWRHPGPYPRCGETLDRADRDPR
jgi:hypothetical protein